MSSFCSGRLAAIAGVVVLFLAGAPAHADVMVQIDKSAQRMSVSVAASAATIGRCPPAAAATARQTEPSTRSR